MYNIFIFEDNALNNDLVKEILLEYRKIQPECFQEIEIYQVLSEFESSIEKIHKNKVETNIYFIDMNLDESINGLELAKAIRKKDINGYIIFLTSHLEWMGMSYNYNLKALNYIYKNDYNMKSILFSSLKQICIEVEQNSRSEQNCHNEETILISYHKNYYKIPLSKILFIETSSRNRNIMIHTVEEVYECTDTLKGIHDKLNERFIMCHKSIIINLDHMKKLEYEAGVYYARLATNQSCRVSRKYYNDVIEKFCLK